MTEAALVLPLALQRGTGSNFEGLLQLGFLVLFIVLPLVKSILEARKKRDAAQGTERRPPTTDPRRGKTLWEMLEQGQEVEPPEPVARPRADEPSPRPEPAARPSAERPAERPAPEPAAEWVELPERAPEAASETPRAAPDGSGPLAPKAPATGPLAAGPVTTERVPGRAAPAPAAAPAASRSATAPPELSPAASTPRRTPRAEPVPASSAGVPRRERPAAAVDARTEHGIFVPTRATRARTRGAGDLPTPGERGAWRRAVVLAEVLGAPLALRDSADSASPPGLRPS